MGMFRPLDVTSSALSAERLRLETSLSNLANANTTRTREGGPYRRREVVFTARPAEGSGRAFADELQGVEARVQIDPDPEPVKVYDPGHPDADAEGYVLRPDIDPLLEQADVVSAARAYEANLAVLKVYKDLLGRALEIGR